MEAWLALRFPFFRLEALGIFPDTEASIVLSESNRVCAATQACLKAGVELGMPSNTAHVMIECESNYRDMHKEQALYAKICDRLYAFTPYIQRYSPHSNEYGQQGLLLELSRSLKLFDGLENLISLIINAISEFNLVCHWASDKKPKAAWLLSLFEGIKSQSSLLDLPCLSLDEYPLEAESLNKMGFLSLNDIKAHIEKKGCSSFKKRFSEDFIAYLNDIFDFKESEPDSRQKSLFPNRRYQPIDVYTPDKKYHDFIDFEYPLSSIELLQEPIKMLLSRLSLYLLKQQKKCSGVTWKFTDIYHNSEKICVRGEEIYRDWIFLYDLSLIKLEQKGLPFEIDCLELIEPELIDASLQTDNFAFDRVLGNTFDTKNLLRVMTKIQARVGEPSVFKVAYFDDHVPEYSQKKISIKEHSNAYIHGEHRYSPRPGWILNAPIGIGLNQNDLRWKGRLELIRGPERIEGHWWGKSSTRDYFIAIREDQTRLWVFNDLDKNEWYVQGIF